MQLWETIKSHLLRYPARTFSDGNITYSYDEALDRAESFAEELNYPCYGILCSSELNTAIALLSCMAAGVIAIPLSYRYGEVHCNRIIMRASLRYVIADDENNDELVIRQISDQHFVKPEGEQPALIMYTSGTTGYPKGTMISQSNLLCNLNDIKQYFQIKTTDRILICRPLYHCAVLTGEFLISIMNGLDIVFYNGDFNPFALCQAIGTYSITVVGGTPTLFYHAALMERRLKKCQSLRIIVTSGECMTPVIASAIRKSFPTVDIYNVYGLTEASPRVSYLAPQYFDEYCTSVGVPLVSLQAKIVDNNGIELPFGEDGELIISGNSVMLGYYNDPDMTEQKIRQGWLYTGDIACISEDGFITVKCRKDNMIIKAGINIYPQEIENVVKQCEGIREAYVYADHNEQGRLIIHLVVESIDKEQSVISQYCRENLPIYEVPDVIYIVESIPKNGSGKILRKKREEPGDS